MNNGEIHQAPTDAETRWLRVRGHLTARRHALAVEASSRYPLQLKVAGTPLLAAPAWVPPRPVPLEAIDLAWASAAPAPVVTDSRTGGDIVCPPGAAGVRRTRYSEFVETLAPPAIFENRTTYRLIGADLAGAAPRLSFTGGTYFDGLDVGEAAAHEYAARDLGLTSSTPLRAAVGDPCDPARRPVNTAISCLTLRVEADGRATFPLHWRDPAKVGHAGGLYQVMPVGVFQASSDDEVDRTNDFSLWRCLVRESEEELLGAGEDHADHGRPIDYARWPFAARLATARDDGTLRLHCLGLGTDPLTFATDLLVTMAIDAPLYDELFARAVAHNDEGRLLSTEEGAGIGGRFVFDRTTVDRFSGPEPMQAAGAALLRLAWAHREVVLHGRST